jgi:hypothetical protein
LHFDNPPYELIVEGASIRTPDWPPSGVRQRTSAGSSSRSFLLLDISSSYKRFDLSRLIKDIVAHLPASDDPSELGPQDFVICALKAHQAYESAPSMAALLGSDTAVVTAINGIPWWYFYNGQNATDGRYLQSVDPGGR